MLSKNKKNAVKHGIKKTSSIFYNFKSNYCFYFLQKTIHLELNNNKHHKYVNLEKKTISTTFGRSR